MRLKGWNIDLKIEQLVENVLNNFLLFVSSFSEKNLGKIESIGTIEPEIQVSIYNSDSD